jgi:NAD(P)-dependent dehydrogenase (short-subunit alcohol dehydrogenase family)
MNFNFKDQRAFISGSTSGIGYAIAKSLASLGCKVLLNGRTQDSVDNAVAKLCQEVPGAGCSGLACDFTQSEQVDALLLALENIDVLVNNVGIYTDQDFFEASDESWNNQWQVNVMSGMRLSKALLPSMLEKNYGRILFISSECAVLTPSNLLAYSVTKTALLGLSKGLSGLTKGSKVTVNSLLPGSTLTEGAENFLEAVAAKTNLSVEQVEKEFFVTDRPNSLIQRFETVEEIAATATFLCSPSASAINGAALRVDGGSIGGLF